MNGSSPVWRLIEFSDVAIEADDDAGLGMELGGAPAGGGDMLHMWSSMSGSGVVAPAEDLWQSHGACL
jgi:hypothetical protein